MKFEIMFNNFTKGESTLLEQLGCILEEYDEYSTYVRNINSIEELEQLQGAVQVLMGDEYYNLLIDFIGKIIYLDNKS
jgi:hypothetical protein